jgi:hypothetical protein
MSIQAQSETWQIAQKLKIQVKYKTNSPANISHKSQRKLQT